MKLLFENWRKFLKEEEAIEKLYKALGEDQQKIFKTLTAEQQLNLAMEWSQEGMPGGLLNEAITIDIEVGDIVLGGKYKNKRMTVKEIGKDELGQPTVNGKPILKFRTEKHLPDNKKSKKTLDTEKEKLDEAKVPKSVLKTLRTWSKKHGKSLLNFKRSDYKAADMGFVKMGETNPNIYHLTDLGREVLAANPPDEEKLNEIVENPEEGWEDFFAAFRADILRGYNPEELVGWGSGNLTGEDAQEFFDFVENGRVRLGDMGAFGAQVGDFRSKLKWQDEEEQYQEDLEAFKKEYEPYFFTAAKDIREFGELLKSLDEKTAAKVMKLYKNPDPAYGEQGKQLARTLAG